MIEARKVGGAFQSSDSDYKSVLNDIWSAPWIELKRAPWAYGIEIDDDKWTISSDYIRASLSKRTINFNIKFPLHMSAAEKKSFRRRLKRIALIYGFVAVYDDNGTGDRLRLRSARKLLAPTSWVHNYRSVLVLAELSLEKFPVGRFPDRCPDGTSLFSHLALDQMQEIVDGGHSTIVNSYGRLDLQFRAGHFEDWVSGGLCCTNRLNAEFPLSPDGLIPQLP